MNATDDWFDVRRLTEHSYAIDEAERYGTFLIEGAARSVVVDAALGIGDLQGLASDLVETPLTLFVTHTHWDHIGAGSQFDDVLVSPRELPPDGRVALDSLTDEFLHRPSTFVDRWRDEGNGFPDGFDPDAYAIDPFAASPASVADGIDLGDRTLELIPLPGHSPGQLGVLDPATKVLYGSDVVHTDLGQYLMFADCDLDDQVATVERLVEGRDDGTFEVLATSHNDPLSGADLEVLDDLLAALRDVRRDERDYEVVETDWGEARSYAVGNAEILTKVDP